MSQELKTLLEYQQLLDIIDRSAGGEVLTVMDRMLLRSIADRLERPGVDAWLKFEGPGNWHLETSVTTAEVQRIFGEFPEVVQNRVRITIEPVKTL